MLGRFSTIGGVELEREAEEMVIKEEDSKLGFHGEVAL